MSEIKGYVVRGKANDADVFYVGEGDFAYAGVGDGETPKTLNTIDDSAVESMGADGCTDVRIFAVGKDGTETPLPTYEEALALLDKADDAIDACEDAKARSTFSAWEVAGEKVREYRGDVSMCARRVHGWRAELVPAPASSTPAGVNDVVTSQLNHLAADPVARAAFNGPLPGLYLRLEALGDQIDAHDLAEPPTSPPAELVSEYHAVREQIAAAEKEARGVPRIVVMPVEPLGSRETTGFVDGPGHHGVGTIKVHSYPKSEGGECVRDFRREHGISIGDLARALRIGVAEMAGIERGSHTTDTAGWMEIMTVLFLLASEPKETRGAEAGYLADPLTRPGVEKFLAGDEEPSE